MSNVGSGSSFRYVVGAADSWRGAAVVGIEYVWVERVIEKLTSNANLVVEVGFLDLTSGGSEWRRMFLCDWEYGGRGETYRCYSDVHYPVEKLGRLHRHIRCPGRQRGCPRKGLDIAGR